MQWPPAEYVRGCEEQESLVLFCWVLLLDQPMGGGGGGAEEWKFGPWGTSVKRS